MKKKGLFDFCTKWCSVKVIAFQSFQEHFEKSTNNPDDLPFFLLSECDEEGQSWILQLRNCGPRQIGKYRALAKSKAGTDSKEWQVQLVPPPKKTIVTEHLNSRPSIHEEQPSKVSPIFRP